jgi:hypothetical protein
MVSPHYRYIGFKFKGIINLSIVWQVCILNQPKIKKYAMGFYTPEQSFNWKRVLEPNTPTGHTNIPMSSGSKL